MHRPEDILGSVEVDYQGNLLDNFQPSGTYRIITNEGMYVYVYGPSVCCLSAPSSLTRNLCLVSLGLSPFLREKLVARLRQVDKEDTSERHKVLD